MHQPEEQLAQCWWLGRASSEGRGTVYHCTKRANEPNENESHERDTHRLFNILVGQARWEHGLDVDGLRDRDNLRAVGHGGLIVAQEGEFEHHIAEAILQLGRIV